MKRGDIVTVALPGDYGKPRPAVIVQSDELTLAGSSSFVICPVTSHITDAEIFRLPVAAGKDTGLKKPSQIMVDKIYTIPRERVGEIIGRIDDALVMRLNRTLAFVVGLAQ